MNLSGWRIRYKIKAMWGRGQKHSAVPVFFWNRMKDNINLEGVVGMPGKDSRRKDKNRKVLRTGEVQRKDGYYVYRWTARNGKRRSVSAKTLEELRKKEEEISRDKSDGIREAEQNITLKEHETRLKRQYASKLHLYVPDVCRTRFGEITHKNIA